MKKRFSPLLYSCVFAFTSIFSFPKVTLAQLRLGIGVQPGLEGYFLEYQQRGLPLNELRGASTCSVGFGAACGKTGAILQKVVEKNSGLSHQELLFKAAGGKENYQRFVRLFSNSSAVPLIPYSSFWRDGNQYILDSHENTGIGIVTGRDNSGLGEVASQFKYAPTTWGNSNLTLRQGLVGLKTSYGLALMEEALKIPNINQKIAEESLNESEASFHQQHFQSAVSALNSGSSGEIQNALFNVLSNPYTKVAAPLNRPNLKISTDITAVDGIALSGEVESLVANAGEGGATFLYDSFDEVVEDSNMPLSALAGVGGVAIIAFLLVGGGGDSGGSNGDSVLESTDEIVATDNNVFVPPEVTGNVPIADNPPTTTITPESQTSSATEVPEPSNTITFFFLSLIFFLFNRRKFIN